MFAPVDSFPFPEVFTKVSVVMEQYGFRVIHPKEFFGPLDRSGYCGVEDEPPFMKYLKIEI